MTAFAAHFPQVVATWARDFNADEVFAAEQSAVIAHLPSLDDEGAHFVQVRLAAGRVGTCDEGSALFRLQSGVGP